MAESRKFGRLFNIVHPVIANEASSGIVRVAIKDNIPSGKLMAYSYWTRTAAGVERVTAHTSNYIQASGVLFISGTFATGDILTTTCQFI